MNEMENGKRKRQNPLTAGVSRGVARTSLGEIERGEGKSDMKRSGKWRP
jgi:hypothetical protein